MSEPTTGALTREQVEYICKFLVEEHLSKDASTILNHDAALRQALAQSEQAAYDVAGTIDQLKERIAQQAQEIKRLQNGLETAYALHTDDDKRLFALEQQLSAMTTDRDEAQKRYETQCEGTMSRISENIRLKSERDSYKQQLAASQARCREMEQDKEQAVYALGQLEEKYLQLQATLAAREAVIDRLKNDCTELVDQQKAVVQEAEQLRNILQAIVSANERGQGVPFQAAMREALLALHVRYDAQRATGSSGGAVCHAKP